ncbi:MAG TPA: SDR family oxidoreductase [Chitinophagales bacterium]|nr:SDR family oxidoreductase [Chitinophagales bacterium]
MNAVITGATRGIGKAITEKFASEGFNVAICARNKKDLDELYDELHQKFPDAEIIAHPCDVSDKKQLKGFSELIKLQWNAVEVLVNNAGIFLPGQVHKEKAGTLDQLMKTNLYSAYFLTQYLVKMMMKEKRGHIFNMCSTASIQSYENGGSYGISKFALLGFSKNLRMEMIPYHVKVTAVISGATYTSSWEGSDLPEKRFMKAEDIASVIWNAYTMSPQTVVEEILVRPMKGDI